MYEYNVDFLISKTYIQIYNIFLVNSNLSKIK